MYSSPRIEPFRTLTGPDLDTVAHLFVTVDAAYDGVYWWRDVREHGLPAARASLVREWHAVAVAYLDDTVIAFAGLDKPDGNNVELIRVMTHPDHTGKGAATACIETLLARADRDGLIVWLDVLANATGAINLYQRLGFTQFDDQPGEHSQRPAIQMRRAHPDNQPSH